MMMNDAPPPAPELGNHHHHHQQQHGGSVMIPAQYYHQNASALYAHHYVAKFQQSSQPDPTMMISDEERGWGIALKGALLNSARFEGLHLSDMEICQHAMVAQGNTVEAMVRIEGMQRFCEEYGIEHSVEQGTKLVAEFIKQQPGYLLHLDVSSHQDACMVSDSAAFSQTAAMENWRTCVAGIYYYHYALQPTLASVRQGIRATVECDGVGWHNFGMEYISRLFEEMFSYLPIKFQCLQAYHTTVVANLLFSLARPFMSANMRDSVQLGLQVNDDDSSGEGRLQRRRLSEFYLQPSLEATNQRLLQRIQTLLAVRLYNDKQFRL